MSTVFIFHGTGGSPDGIWIPWLKERLQSDGHTVIAPAFPDPDHPVLQTWLDHFEQFRQRVDASSIFVGHSLGGAFALRLLERLELRIAATFLVASVSGIMGNDIDPLVSTFNVPPYDWNAIHNRSRSFSVIHSDNDPYIPLSQAEHLARSLGTTVMLVPGEGHFSTDQGYTAFPFLLERITSSYPD